MKNEKYPPSEPAAFGYPSAPPEAAENYAKPPSYSQHSYPSQAYTSAQTYEPPQTYPGQLHAQQVYPPQQPYPAPQYASPPPPQYAPPPQQYAPPPQQYAPPPQQYGPIPPIQQPPVQIVILSKPSGCFHRSRLNRPQMNALAASSLIFTSGGMFLAWSVGFRSDLYYNLSTHVKMAWFIAAIIGAAISSFLPRVIPRRVITLISAMLVLIGGIVNVSTHYDVQALTANLYLNGIANGLVFAPTLGLAGELAVFYMRGKLSASTEQMSFNLGIFLRLVLAATYTPSYYHSDGFNPERIAGIIAIIFGFMALIFASLVFIESPVTMLIHGREMAATEALNRLQKQITTTDQTVAQLQEHKLYVAENNLLTTEQSFSHAVPAFFKLAIFRGLNAISICTYIRDLMDLTWWMSNRDAFLILGACRLGGSILSYLVVDAIGRKIPAILGLAGCCTFAFMTAARFEFGISNYVWLYCFELCAGIAFTTSSAYLTEAFPLRVKHHFISYCFIIELLVFIIFGVTTLNQSFMYAVGAIYAVGIAFSIFCLPETRQTSLRVAQKRFYGFLSFCRGTAADNAS